jgi:hypothetical protein
VPPVHGRPKLTPAAPKLSATLILAEVRAYRSILGVASCSVRSLASWPKRSTGAEQLARMTRSKCPARAAFARTTRRSCDDETPMLRQQTGEFLSEHGRSCRSLKAFAAAEVPCTTISWWRVRLRSHAASRFVLVRMREAPRGVEVVVGDVVVTGSCTSATQAASRLNVERPIMAVGLAQEASGQISMDIRLLTQRSRRCR